MEIDPVVEVRRATQQLSRRLRAERPVDGLSSTKLAVLAQLLDYGPRTSGELARHGRSTPQALTRSIDGLVRDGMVERQQAENDKRQHMLTITATGRAQLAKEAAPKDVWLDAAMTELLTPAERQVLTVAAGLMRRLADFDEGRG
ncbi:MarR family winged helix-turn-helix transcriptional regulator [Pseudonocardia spinosispora]|uniref:MarR family winged helix-turn-helix transcriptional regulator n=1 Tax=Pseudonocardia spinosispora TaxID=103441 RepID=UPI000560AD9D|nr:MarR family transcriptional regulator [Pseudonocardia spinosispora]